MRKRVLIRGFYGVSNLGDDFILYSILDMLNKIGGGYDVSVLIDSKGSDDYEYLFEKFDNLNCKAIPSSTWRRFGKIRLLLKTDYVILGGGGLFPTEDCCGLKGLLKEFRIAKCLKTKTCIYGVDINSISKPEAKELWKKISNVTCFIVTRNRNTYNMLSDIGCSHVFRSCDLTFALETEPEKNDNKSCLERLKIREGEYVIWAALMPWPQWEYDESKHGERYRLYINNLQEIANLPQFDGLTHVFLPFHAPSELPMLYDLVKGIKGKTIIVDRDNTIDISEKRLLFKYAKQSVVLKFHGFMFSLYNATPAAVVSYSNKFSDVLDEFGLEKYSTRYGIRESSDFYKEFDLNMDEFRTIVERSSTKQAKTDFKHASEKLRSMASVASDRLADWLQ